VDKTGKSEQALQLSETGSSIVPRKTSAQDGEFEGLKTLNIGEVWREHPRVKIKRHIRTMVRAIWLDQNSSSPPKKRLWYL
jgi:hypothetical protein